MPPRGAGHPQGAGAGPVSHCRRAVAQWGDASGARGGLALASLAQALGKEALLVPPVTAEEARLVEGLPVYPMLSLAQAAAFLEGREALKPLAPGGRATFSRSTSPK